jgi:rhomboid protease GluP
VRKASGQTGPPLQDRRPARPSARRFPVLTASTLGLTALITATRLFTDGPLDALRRDPSALGDGQLWRLISPVLVQSDSSPVNVVLVFAVCAAIGIYGERFLSRRRWLTLYLSGALAGHAIGEAFQPLEGGTSVAFVGILGGLAAYSLLEYEPALVRWKPQAAIAIPLAILDTALGDIHGVPFIVGLVIGAAWVLREEPAGSRGLRLRKAPRFRRTQPGDSVR